MNITLSAGPLVSLSWHSYSDRAAPAELHRCHLPDHHRTTGPTRRECGAHLIRHFCSWVCIKCDGLRAKDRDFWLGTSNLALRFRSRASSVPAAEISWASRSRTS